MIDHLWQSTLFAAVVGLFTFAFRKNGAHVRYWLWFAASVKFLIPFSLLTALGRQIEWPVVPTPAFDTAASVVQIFATPTLAGASAPAALGVNIVMVLTVVWLCGVVAVTSLWITKWLQVWALARKATPAHLEAPVPVKTVPTLLEPGVIGIFKPVILLPQGITEYLAPPELRAIIAHELAHVRRHDNLTATIHMIVQAAFWFHPMVWWIGAKLVAERERACDEAVMMSGDSSENYAEGILKVCKFYVETPVMCASGVSATNLSKRIEWIMTNRGADKLGLAKQLLVSAAALALIAVPVFMGWASAHAQDDGELTSREKMASDGGTGRPPEYRVPVYYDFPRMVVNIDGAGQPYYLKLLVTAEIKCVMSDCKAEIDSIATVLPSIMDGFHEYARGLKRDELQGREGMALLRTEFLRRLRDWTAPTQIKGVLVKEMLVTDTP